MVQYADRMKYVSLESDMAPMLDAARDPDMISFAIGSPAPETFQKERIAAISDEVLRDQGDQALQYSPICGHEPLRRQIAQRVNKVFGAQVAADDVMITTGSQQGLDLVGKLFCNEGDVVLCESPTYLAALNSIRTYGPEFKAIATDENGIVVEDLARLLKENPNTKFVYTIPYYQNPTGRLWSLERRQQFMALMQDYDIPIIEDNPYGELCFEGEILPSLKSMDTKGQVIYMGTFSKTFCPGYRIGWTIAEPEIMKRLLALKENTDLHTSTINQFCLAAYLEKYDLDKDVAGICNLYHKRRDVMLKAMADYFPEGVRWTHPQGGLFVWVSVPDQINTKELLHRAMANKVMFIPGAAFFPAGEPKNCMRINFSNMPEERIVEGVKRLAQAIKEELAAKNEL